jgi:hypothetical protein
MRGNNTDMGSDFVGLRSLLLMELRAFSNCTQKRLLFYWGYGLLLILLHHNIFILLMVIVFRSYLGNRDWSWVIIEQRKGSLKTCRATTIIIALHSTTLGLSSIK